MHLLAVLLTSKAALINTLEDPHLDLSANILRNARANAHRLTTVGFDPQRQAETFTEFLGKRVGLVDNRPPDEGGYDGVVVLHSHDATPQIAAIRDGVFASAFDGHEFIENRSNFLIRSFGRLIKNFVALMRTMHDKTRMEAAILPSHNFDCADFRAFLNFCQDEAGARDFPNRVGPILTQVTRRRGPRRRSKDQTKYFRDDQGVHFQYGHEVHSSFATGGNHGPSCSIRGIFRFGVPLEQQRHFNVVKGDDGKSFSGSYGNCHADIVKFTGRTHLNMFSNDFFK